MTLVRICVIVSAALATILFMVALRVCFRTDGTARREKPWMIASIYAWTALEWWALLALPAPPETLQWVGVAVFWIAIGLFLWSVRSLRAARPSLAFVNAMPSRLITRGPYRRVRHPIYTSYFLAWIGGALATGQWWLLLAIVWMGWFYVRAATTEERGFLESPLAAEFREYQGRTGMFLPSIHSWRTHITPTQ